ncbi:hypothetical protein LEP1GSC196_1057 [Leptospira meyeri serovar Semaranga str. Veldrot Semarang 173]|nr:hypothetical protein LEP1GSC196_1057 [Leptospira meyeri serovar Semaranga str. Veldrot Semarang 173]
MSLVFTNLISLQETKERQNKNIPNVNFIPTPFCIVFEFGSIILFGV